MLSFITPSSRLINTLQRAAFRPEHYNLDSPLGTPGVASEGFPTTHDMNVIRQSVHLSEDGKIQRNMSDKTFWDGVVADAIAILEPGRVSNPLQIYHQVSSLNYFDVCRLYHLLSFPIKIASMVCLLRQLRVK